MIKTYKGTSSGRGKKIAIVVSKFNEFITQRLLKGCLAELKRCGVTEKNVSIVWVPGSYEIPLMALKLAEKKNVDYIICLGAVIRGETLHFELVAWGTAYGIAKAALLSGRPVIFGVLAVDTVQQAYKRSQENASNKGKDAAAAALEMVDLMRDVG